VSLTDVAWAAGFFDGEGHIGLERRNDRRGQIYLRLTTTQKTPEALRRLQKLFGGRVFYDHHVWRHRIERCHARRMLEALMPFLAVKRGRAEEVLSIVPAKGPCA